MRGRIHLSPPDVTEAEEQALLRALRSGWVAPLGPEVDAFEAENEDPGRIAKRLQKARVIDRYHAKAEIFTMARRADGDCTFLHPQTRRCTVYAQRPDTCRLHPQQKSPRPGYCAFGVRTP